MSWIKSLLILIDTTWLDSVPRVLGNPPQPRLTGTPQSSKHKSRNASPGCSAFQDKAQRLTRFTSQLCAAQLLFSLMTTLYKQQHQTFPFPEPVCAHCHQCRNTKVTASPGPQCHPCKRERSSTSLPRHSYLRFTGQNVTTSTTTNPWQLSEQQMMDHSPIRSAQRSGSQRAGG